jgi:hypothetical protein
MANHVVLTSPSGGNLLDPTTLTAEEIAAGMTSRKVLSLNDTIALVFEELMKTDPAFLVLYKGYNNATSANKSTETDKVMAAIKVRDYGIANEIEQIASAEFNDIKKGCTMASNRWENISRSRRVKLLVLASASAATPEEGGDVS